MAGDYIPHKDAEALVYCRTFVTVVANDPARFGVAPDEVAALQNVVGQFGQSLQHISQLEAERAAEVQQKNQLRKDMDARVRALVQRIQVQPGIEEAVKAQAGITLRDHIQSTASPVAPEQLVVEAQANGVNKLKWHRAGNPRDTEFLIEARLGAATEFTLIDVVRASYYQHEGVKPGEPILYHVRARHSGKVSEPSNQAGAYL